MAARRKQVQRLEGERDAARANEHKLQRELEQYKASTLDRDRELDRLRNQRNRFDVESKEVARLRTRNAELEQAELERQEMKRRFSEIASERDAALAAQQVAEASAGRADHQARAQLTQVKDRCDEAVAALQREQSARESLEEQLAKSSHELAELREQHSQAEDALAAEQQMRDEVQTQRDADHEEIAALRQRCRKLQDAEERVAKIQVALNDDRQRLQQVAIERDAAFAAEIAAKEKLAQLELTTSSEEHDRLRKQREEVVRELEKVRDERERLQRAVLRQEEQITSLQAHVCRLEADSTSDVVLAERLSQQAERLRKVSLEHELNSASLGQAEQTIHELQQLLSSRESMIESLRRERDKALRTLTSPPTSRIDETSRVDPKLGVLFLQPPVTVDDLTRIEGIGTDVARKLNEFGVYQYQQIASWDTLAIAEFSKLLASHDRIQREDWNGQARRLVEGHRERAA